MSFIAEGAPTLIAHHLDVPFEMVKQLFFVSLLLITTSQRSNCQLLTDTLFTWKGYSEKGLCGLQLYQNAFDTKKTYTIILREIGENKGPTTIEEINYLVEQIGRSFDLDPTNVYWIIHWGHFSYSGAARSNKELFIRATFSRTSTMRLGAPQWRIIHTEDIERYTDRQFSKKKG